MKLYFPSREKQRQFKQANVGMMQGKLGDNGPNAEKGKRYFYQLSK